MSDLIERKELGAAIDNWLTIDRYYHPYSKQKTIPVSELIDIIKLLPSAQPTLYGYSIEHLALIARVMQKENVTPEKAIEYFKDIQRIVQMVFDEQQEMIRRAVEKWMI